MRRRWRAGPGPVFAWEWVTGSRRWQPYAGRVLFGGVLLASVWLMWERYAGRVMSPSDLGRVGQSLYVAYVLSQLGLIVLVTPATTSGAICQEKARGSLLHLMTTDLSDAEVVFGKLLARFVPALMLLAAGVPVVMICGLLGGLDLEAVLGASAVTVGTALLCCSGALLISVWARRPHGALMAAYFALLCWLLLVPLAEMLAVVVHMWLTDSFGTPLWYPALPLMANGDGAIMTGMPPPSWLAWTHPYWLVMAPYSAPGLVTLADQLRFLGVSVAVSGLMGLVSTRSLRRVYLRQLGRPRKPTKYLRLPRLGRNRREQGLGDRGWLPGPSLDANPVLWREWHRNAPSLPERILWHVFTIMAVVLYFPLLVDVVLPGPPTISQGLLAVAIGSTVTYGLLLLAVSASTSMAEERARGSLDVLMSTPLSTGQIVWGKWWGAFRGVIVLALLPTAVAVPLGIKQGKPLEPLLTIGLILSYGAVLTSLGLMLATFVAKQGHAIGLSVAAYGALCLGWPLLVVLLVAGGPSDDEPFLLQAPWFGAHRLLAPLVRVPWPMSSRPHYEPPGMLGGAAAWITINALISAALVARTLSGFNRRLGRMEENPAYAGRVTVVLESGPQVEARAPAIPPGR